MTVYLRSPLTLVWALLIAVTSVSWWVSAGGTRGGSDLSVSITTAVIVIAFVKARFVFRYFMEVRTGPSWLRATCDGWVAGVGIILLSLYAYGLPAERFR